MKAATLAAGSAQAVPAMHMESFDGSRPRWEGAGAAFAGDLKAWKTRSRACGTHRACRIRNDMNGSDVRRRFR